MTLTGPASRIHRSLESKVERARSSGSPLRLFFSGSPGVGKSATAALLARRIAGHELGIEKINGADVGADTVRHWREHFTTASMFSDWRVLVIEEADKVSAQAQVLMLTLLDDLPPRRAILCTSNLDTGDLTPRFQTRFQFWTFTAPTAEEIHILLRERFPGLPAAKLTQISHACQGNVRSALLDAETAADFAAN